MIKIRRALPFAIALSFAVASCGGSSDGGGDDAESPATVAESEAETDDDFSEAEEAEPEEAEPEEVEPEVVEPEEAEPEEVEPEEVEPEEVEEVEPEESGGEAEAGESASVDVALSEWAITAPAEYSAGEITFNASNGGNFPHELVVIEGEGYEALPLAEGGAVIEDDLPTGALIGRTARVGGGSTEALTVTLAPGNYVLVCNLGGGDNSHAGQGQRLDITVT